MQRPAYVFDSLTRAVADLQRHHALTDLRADALRSRADFRQGPGGFSPPIPHRRDAGGDLAGDRQQARLMALLKALLRLAGNVQQIIELAVGEAVLVKRLLGALGKLMQPFDEAAHVLAQTAQRRRLDLDVEHQHGDRSPALRQIGDAFRDRLVQRDEVRERLAFPGQVFGGRFDLIGHRLQIEAGGAQLFAFERLRQLLKQPRQIAQHREWRRRAALRHRGSFVRRARTSD
jgi:hypothetical protein